MRGYRAIGWRGKRGGQRDPSADPKRDRFSGRLLFRRREPLSTPLFAIGSEGAILPRDRPTPTVALTWLNVAQQWDRLRALN
jgi:hypothetical protein